MDLLIRKIPPEKMKEYNMRFQNDFLPLIKKWQQEGSVIDHKPEVIVGCYKPCITQYCIKDFDDEVFEEMIELLVDIVAKGLVIEEEIKLYIR